MKAAAIHNMPDDFEIKSMIADYMENGFLDNIIDMFKHDKSLYRLTGELMTDERIRVRIGTAALIETLKNEDHDNVVSAVPFITALLKNNNPSLRGDAAYLLGIIGDMSTLPYIREMLHDENKYIREIAAETIEEIEKRCRD